MWMLFYALVNVLFAALNLYYYVTAGWWFSLVTAVINLVAFAMCLYAWL